MFTDSSNSEEEGVGDEDNLILMPASSPGAEDHTALARRDGQVSRGNESQAVLAGVSQAPNVHEVAISGGEFQGASFDSKTYHITKRDETVSGEIRQANFGEQVVQYIQAQYNITRGGSEETEQAAPARRGSATTSGCIQLSDNIKLFKTKPLCHRAFVYEGEEVSEITGSRKMAIKFLAPYGEKDIKEARLLLRLAHHPNVISIIHSDKYDGGAFPTMYIAMELCSTQSLGDYITEESAAGRKINFTKRHEFVKEVAEGLAFIHKNRIVHRDLKPDNILFSIDGKTLKISDFGLGKEIRQGCSVTRQSSTRIGTDGYRAPETYNEDVISQQADVFSFGLIVHIILTTGDHPYGNEPDLWNYYIKTNANCVIKPLPRMRSKTYRDVIEACLKFRPRERPTMEELLGQPLAYPFGTELRGKERPHNQIVVRDRRSDTILCHHVTSQTWTTVSDTPEDIIQGNVSVVELKGYLHFLLDNKSAYCLEWSQTASNWTRVADMKEYHGRYTPAVSHEGYIYAVGNGYSPQLLKGTTFLERYCYDEDQWERAANMIRPREHHYVAVVGSYIYCCGGSRNELWTVNPAVERYDINKNEWKEIAPMPTGIESLPVDIVSAQEKVYVIGDGNLQIYDTNTSDWNLTRLSGTSICLGGSPLKSVCLGQHIYTITKTGRESKLYQLDLQKFTWKTLHSMGDTDINPMEITTIFMPEGAETRPKSLFSSSEFHPSTSDIKQYPVSLQTGSPTESILLFDHTLAAMRAYTPARNVWTDLQKAPQDIMKSNFNVAILNDSIYILFATSLYQLNLLDADATWSRKADMSVSHGWSPPALAMEGYIFVIGQEYSIPSLPISTRDVSERYDPHTNKWTRIADMITPKVSHYLAGQNGYIYCLAGRDEKFDTGVLSVERYHTATDVWEKVKPMLRAMESSPFGCQSLGGKLYAIDRQMVQTYDPTDDKWNILVSTDSFPFERITPFRVLVVDGEIMVVAKSQRRNFIWKFVLESLKWEVVTEVRHIDMMPGEAATVTLKKRSLNYMEEIFHHYR